jgi:hypothetical protein
MARKSTGFLEFLHSVKNLIDEDPEFCKKDLF